MKSNLRVAAAALFLGAISFAAIAHEGEHYSAGVPGNPKKPARVVEVTMRDGDGKMEFVPEHIDVKKGEQVRFIIKNQGALKHEFTLASVTDNNKHAELMKKYPDMEHDDPNAKSVDPGKSAEILWRFSKGGTFEFACLIPGHREAGMRGTVTVK
ncbi:MAG TPA: cupredoxin family protein [Nitrospira sp.]|nr:cupredoxin family protein [Nitrospira sp.]